MINYCVKWMTIYYQPILTLADLGGRQQLAILPLTGDMTIIMGDYNHGTSTSSFVFLGHDKLR